MTELRKYTIEFFLIKKGEPAGLGWYGHFLAENFEKAEGQAKTYLRMFEGCFEVRMDALYEGWTLRVTDQSESEY
jgi:hypothetical protein